MANCPLLGAEMLLDRIRWAHVNFAADPGGPSTAREKRDVIERWIDSYFAGTFYGDVQLVPDEKHRARCSTCHAENETGGPVGPPV